MTDRFDLNPDIHRLRYGSQVGRTIYAHTGDDPKGVLIGVMDSKELAAVVCAAVNTYFAKPQPAPPENPRADPLSATCPACLADPGDPCYTTSTDEPRRHPHRLRRLAAAKCLTQCTACGGVGWRPTDDREAR